MMVIKAGGFYLSRLYQYTESISVDLSTDFREAERFTSEYEAKDTALLLNKTSQTEAFKVIRLIVTTEEEEL